MFEAWKKSWRSYPDSVRPRQSVTEVFGLIASVCLVFGGSSILVGGVMRLFSMDASKNNYVALGLISAWLGVAFFLVTFILARLKKK